jgi:hypothetical protein
MLNIVIVCTIIGAAIVSALHGQWIASVLWLAYAHAIVAANIGKFGQWGVVLAVWLVVGILAWQHGNPFHFAFAVILGIYGLFYMKRRRAAGEALKENVEKRRA